MKAPKNMIKTQKRKNKRSRTRVLIGRLKDAILKVSFWMGIDIGFLLLVQSVVFFRNGEYLSMLITGSLFFVP